MLTLLLVMVMVEVVVGGYHSSTVILSLERMISVANCLK